MLTKKQYVEYLLSTPLNYTCTNLANQLGNANHDSICDFYSIDFRIYSPETDGKTKNEHFQERYLSALLKKNLKHKLLICFGG